MSLEKYIKELIIKTHTEIDERLIRRIRMEAEVEENPYAKIQYENMIKSLEISSKESLPICQDTGFHYFYIKFGENVNLREIISCIEKSIKELEEEFLRENLMHPIDKYNLKGFFKYDLEYIPCRDFFEIIYLPKGAGSENVSKIYMLNPNNSLEDIFNIIIDDVEKNARKACPPIILGIGIGGDFSTVTKLSRKALIRGFKYNDDPRIRRYEEILELRINELNIGPMGLGGRLTCMKVNIEIEPCHIATLPLAINYSCWVYRRKVLRYQNGKYVIE